MNLVAFDKMYVERVGSVPYSNSSAYVQYTAMRDGFMMAATICHERLAVYKKVILEQRQVYLNENSDGETVCVTPFDRVLYK